ncbi:MAG: hypothetical protein HFJ60_03275 [Clostridia bacterium]|nr:hypothetical protein [Clostridia bacterium]
MKDFWIEQENVSKKSINKKKIIILIIIAILTIATITVSAIYINNKEARNWIDKNILQKEKTQNNLPSIEIEENNSNVYAFNRYIGVFSKNNFSIYNSVGNKENELTLEITKPIFNSNNRYLAVAEEKGQKLYIIEDNNILWEKDIEGNIAQVTINKNGYVAVTIVDTIHKTVIEVYDNHGEHLFSAKLATTRVVATSISEDNKYLATAEIDTSGTMVQSNVKIISIEESKSNPQDAIKKIYNGENGDLITNIKYQEKNKLLCMYSNKITLIKSNGTVEILQEFNNKKVSFASIELSNHTITVEEKSSGIFTADSVVNIINSENKSKSLYTAESVTKEIYTSSNAIALNLGSEVEFINTSGWLLKKYIAEQEITNIVLSDSVAGIIYRDKIEIINL